MVLVYREAATPDLQQIKEVRFSVHENRLRDPSRITDAEYIDYLNNRGKGWVRLHGDRVAGFSIADLKDKNVWALFVRPKYERKGIGKRLHDLMLDWYFSETKETIWLGTEPGSRAESFYLTAGWLRAGMHADNEVKFEMPYKVWMEKDRRNLYA